MGIREDGVEIDTDEVADLDAPEEGNEQEEVDTDTDEQDVDEAARLQRFADILGGVDDSVDVADLDKIDQEMLDKNLTPQGRALLRKQAAAARSAQDALRAEAKTARDTAAAERAQLEKDREALRQSKLAYAKMLGNEDMRSKIKAGLEIDPDKIDYTSPEGIRQLIDRKVAEQLDTLTKPAADQAAAIELDNRRAAFNKKYPEMNDPVFAGKIQARLERIKAETGSVAGQMERVVLQQLREEQLAEAEAKKAARLKRSRRSATHTSKTTTTAQAAVDGEVPRSVRRQGGAAIARWLKANPKKGAAALEKARY